MTVDSHFTVAVDRQNAVCTLSVSSVLDFTPVEGLTQQAACLGSHDRQLVLDLSPLRFADCCGARALEAVTGAVPR
jgi:anti-anti-sigma regulatory factor